MQNATTLIGEVLNVDEAAEFLGVATKTLLRWIQRKDHPVPVAQPGGKSGRLFIWRDHLVDWFRREALRPRV